MAFTLTVSFTFFIFWGLCAPFAHGLNLWTYGNLALHLFTPALAVLDYALFCEPGHLKKRDIFLCVLIPAAYISLVTVLNFCGVVFYVHDGTVYHAPYPFMDFRFHAVWTIIFVSVAATAFCALAALLYFIDSKRRKTIP